jgi:hypothetical protein
VKVRMHAAALAASVVIGLFPVVVAARGLSPCEIHVASREHDLGLDADQLANATLVVEAAAALAMDRRGAVIGVMTALTESSLRNLDHGDDAGPDSRGLFQQRAAWGSQQARMDPSGASRLFFQALAQVPAWRQVPPWVAAQAVQRSAFADGRNYRSNYRLAVQVERAVGSLPAPRAACAASVQFGSGREQLPGADRAVARAYRLVGRHGYFQLCARLAANIWGRQTAGYASASDQWDAMVVSGNAHEDRRPPVGALLFWATIGRFGHVAVYVGGGLIVSNDIEDRRPGEGGVYLLDVSEIESRWGARYLGWAAPVYAASQADVR